MEIKLCENCGARFIPNRNTQKYCCVPCRRESLEKRGYKCRKKNRIGEERAFTDLTVYLVHKWVIEGLSTDQISKILSRSERNIKRILEVELTEKQKKTMSEYICKGRR